MDIVGLGTDVVECIRIRSLIDRHGEMFLHRVYTPREIRACQTRSRSTEAFACRWSAKEAVLKSLGVGERGVHRVEVEIRTAGDGPQVVLNGAMRERAEEMGVRSILLSMSACRSYALATAIAVR